MRSALAVLCTFVLLIFGGACRKKDPQGTEDLRLVLLQSNAKLRDIAPLLDERAKPESIRQGALRLENVLKEQYAAAQALLKKYPNLMADRPQFEATLSTEFGALRESIGLLVRRIKYWQKRLPNDKVFNDAINRTARMSTSVEMQTRPAND